MNLALLGVGLMGYPVAERLLQSGHQLTVYNRTIAKVYPLKEKGARIARTPQEAWSEAEGILLTLSDAQAIADVLFSGTYSDFLGKTIIQMGTIGPSESRAIQKELAARGADYFECPVLGSRQEAAEGTFILLVGSSDAQFQKWKGFFKALGPDPWHIGGVGQAAALKLALNQLIASHAVGFSLSLGLIERNHIPVEIFMDILRQSALYAPMFDKKLANWLRRDYARPNFPAKHLFKDVALIFQEAKDKGLSTESLEALRQLLLKTMDKGLGDLDYSSVFNAVNNI